MPLKRIHIVSYHKQAVCFNEDHAVESFTTRYSHDLTPESAYSIVMDALAKKENPSSIIFDDLEEAKNYARTSVDIAPPNTNPRNLIYVYPIITVALCRELTGLHSFISVESVTLAIGNRMIVGQPLVDQLYPVGPRWEQGQDKQDDYKIACKAMLQNYKKNKSPMSRLANLLSKPFSKPNPAHGDILEYEEKINHSTFLHLQEYLKYKQSQTYIQDALKRKLPKGKLPKSYNSHYFGMLITMRKMLANDHSALEQKEGLELLHRLTLIPSDLLNLVTQYLMNAGPLDKPYSSTFSVNGILAASLCSDGITVTLDSVAPSSPTLTDFKRSDPEQPRVTSVTVFRGASISSSSTSAPAAPDNAGTDERYNNLPTYG